MADSVKLLFIHYKLKQAAAQIPYWAISSGENLDYSERQMVSQLGLLFISSLTANWN